MKAKLWLSLILLPLLMGGCISRVSLDAYKYIKITGECSVSLAQGFGVSAVNSGNVSVKVENDTLFVDGQAEQYIGLIINKSTLENLELIEIHDNASLELDDLDFIADNIDISLDGSSTLKGKTDFTGLSLNITDEAKAELEGQGNDVSIEATENSEVDFEHLECHNATINASDNAILHVFADQTLTVAAADDALVVYYGNPNQIVGNSTENAEIIQGDKK